MKYDEDRGEGLSKSKLIIIISIALAAAVILGVVITKKVSKKSGFRPGDAQTTFSVKTQTAAVTVLHDYIETNGDIEAVNSVSVYPNIGGKIVSTEVGLGSAVRKGDVIAKVDPSVPGSSYSLSPVYSPISGRVVSAPLKAGTTVTTSTAVAIVGDVASLQITAQIAERYVAALKNGLKAEITLEAYPDAVFHATVTHVSPVVDSTTRTKEIILTFDNNDQRINAGMFGKVKLYTYDYGGYVTVPSDAIVTKSDKLYVYVLKDTATVEQREITKGNTVDGIVQIVSGVNPGDSVVVEGEQVLSDGSAVKDITNGVKTENKK